jgi:hypothetical protein
VQLRLLGLGEHVEAQTHVVLVGEGPEGGSRGDGDLLPGE